MLLYDHWIRIEFLLFKKIIKLLGNVEVGEFAINT
ncbi:MAG: hypothetical protein UU89_C0016G0002 [Parcubacteria group bacterium GW2011_GWC2_42_11]|nr:MAG: hypothetical protein UU89_C0016G0002 [Parcubacteria group bacterium GW2011_GWC2_42_11]